MPDEKVLGVIYDTSYLMLDKCLDIKLLVGIAGCWKEKRNWYGRIDRESSDATRLISVVQVVPKPVAEEIRGHFKDEEKHKSARRARKRVASIVERGGLEIDVANVVPASSDAILGADSETDRRVIAYAIQMVRTDWSAAVVATDDGGILYDMVKLRKDGIPVFGFANDRVRQFGEFVSTIPGNGWSCGISSSYHFHDLIESCGLH